MQNQRPVRTLRPLLVRGGVVGAGALAVLGLSVVPAFAHVSVQPEGPAPKGGYATVDFKVPNERDDASTVKLEVSFPTDHPLASVMPQPVPGWKAEVSKVKPAKPLESHGRKIDEVVSKVTWTAEGKGVEPGYFQKFPVSLGQLPADADALEFKALQTYSDKEIVRWIEPQSPGGEEPEHPAPSLALTAAEDAHHGAAPGAEGEKAEEAQASGDGGSSSDTTARVLAGAGIAVGLAGVAFGVLAGRRRQN